MTNQEVFEIFRLTHGKKIASQITAAISDRGWYKPYSVARLLTESEDDFLTSLREIRKINQSNRNNFPVRKRKIRKPRTAKIIHPTA